MAWPWGGSDHRCKASVFNKLTEPIVCQKVYLAPSTVLIPNICFLQIKRWHGSYLIADTISCSLSKTNTLAMAGDHSPNSCTCQWNCEVRKNGLTFNRQYTEFTWIESLLFSSWKRREITLTISWLLFFFFFALPANTELRTYTVFFLYIHIHVNVTFSNTEPILTNT